MYQWSKSESRLNRYVGLLEGQSLSFLIHYWGVVQHLASNSMHKHSFFEVCYVNGGTGVYTEGDIEYPLYKGVTICTRPNLFHQIKDVDQLDLLFVAFETLEQPSGAEAAENYTSALNRGAVWIEHSSESPSILLWKSLLLRSQPNTSLPVSLLPKLAHALLESFSFLLGSINNLESTPIFSNSAQLVRRAKLYIRDNLSGHLSLPEVANFLNVSERQLSRLFASSIHESFSSLVRTERIRAAELLLKQTNDPIKLIAERTGFSSVHYLTRVFTQAKGVPPAAFRATLTSAQNED
ncbi:AraC family transcriptional regulator [Paenibacillus sp. Marseille-Q4541]|uniref:helix-turn-helix domain-containing protein n=1 Tax=Paenibacillus sp. Marseille-Q4541 TaxID=2831522 RepID=UPI001BA56C02|nr:AraC family transcriptional regulator [Paenibacillus sp. Marseille-Q4541]